MAQIMGHKPVLLNEVLELFAGLELAIFFDGTVGGGGHAKALLKNHPEIKTYLACDRDPVAHAHTKTVLEGESKGKVVFIEGSYADLNDFLNEREIQNIDGFFIDVGVSSMQIDDKQRGFSFLGDAPLDMRMDPKSSLTAEKIINEAQESELARIFYEYGEERYSRKIARTIVAARKKKKVRSTNELVRIIWPGTSRGRIHPATRIFQALRIAVNDELGQLKRGLEAAIKRLRPGGRLAAISFHSLEDRIVKNVIRDAKGICANLTKKPIVPTKDEIKVNPRSRSAKLRGAEKV